MDLNSGDATPLLEEDAEETLNEEQEEEQQVPPFTMSCCTSVICWAKQLWYPISILVGNLVSLVLIQYLDGKAQFIMYSALLPDNSSDSSNDSLQFMFTVSIAVSLFTFLVDSYIFLQGARRMSRKVAEEHEQEQQDQEENSANIDFVKISRSVDAAFGCTSSAANATFFVCLLYAFFSLAVSRAASTGSSLVRVQVLTPVAEMQEIGKCFFPSTWRYMAEEEEDGVSSLQESPQFSSLPEDVQSWVKAHTGTRIPRFNRSLPFIQDTDGTMVFSYKSYEPSKWREDQDAPISGLAVFSPGNNSVAEYPVPYDSNMELVGFPANPPYYGWCGVYEKLDIVHHLQHEVICYNGKTSELKRFSATTDDKKDWVGWSLGGGRGRDENMHATEDTLWVVTKRDITRGNRDFTRRKKESNEILISLVAYDIKTMERTLAAERNVIKTLQSNVQSHIRSSMPIPSCWDMSGFWSSTVALCLVTIYLYRLDVASCALPASLTFASILNLVLPSTLASFFMVLSVCMCLYLLVARRGTVSIWKYLTVEMMVWALYSLYGSTWWLWMQQVPWSDVSYFWENFFYYGSGDVVLQFFMIGMTIVISVLLNHPIFTIWAIWFSVVGASVCRFVLLGGPEFLLVSLVMFALSFGCFRFGAFLRLYRVHVIVYARRAWRCVQRSAMARA